MRNFLANFLILFGLLLLIISSYLTYQKFNPNKLAFERFDESVLVTASSSQESKPVSVLINDLDINLSVIPAEITKNRWETTTKGVSYLTSSAIPGKVGNSIFYGHNYKNILANLKSAKPGQVINIKMEDGTWRNFRIEYVQEVSPKQVGVLDQTSDKRLTIYTCTGFLDSKRLVITAFLMEG